MTLEEDGISRKKQRPKYVVQTHQKSDQVTMDSDESEPPLQLQPFSTETKGGPAGPSWSCRGCGRCRIHHTQSVTGCWACMQIMLNGPVFDADRWGDFLICQQTKAARSAHLQTK